MYSNILMGLNAEESQYILQKMYDDNLDRKATGILINDVRAKRWVRLNAVAYLADKLQIEIEAELDGYDGSDDSGGPRSKKGKGKKQRTVSQVTNQNFGHFMTALTKRKERAFQYEFHFFFVVVAIK